MTAPILYSIFWLVLFGGIGIRHEREASNMGLCCKTSENWFLDSAEVSDVIFQKGKAKFVRFSIALKSNFKYTYSTS